MKVKSRILQDGSIAFSVKHSIPGVGQFRRSGNVKTLVELQPAVTLAIDGVHHLMAAHLAQRTAPSEPKKEKE